MKDQSLSRNLFKSLNLDPDSENWLLLAQQESLLLLFFTQKRSSMDDFTFNFWTPPPIWTWWVGLYWLLAHCCKYENFVQNFFQLINCLNQSFELFWGKIQHKSNFLVLRHRLDQKQTNKFDFTTMVLQVNFFLFFLEELKTPKRHFEITGPFL